MESYPPSRRESPTPSRCDHSYRTCALPSTQRRLGCGPGWALSLFLSAGLAGAGEFNPLLSVGDRAPSWNQLPGTDDRLHSLEDLAEKEVVIVVFTCNTCPYAVDYEDRLNSLATRFEDQGGRIALVAINVNRIEEDRLPAMKQRAQAKGFRFPYLFDESQEIARRFGALRTPECFVLDRERRIVYMGSWDDHSNPAQVGRRYVELAVEATLRHERAEIVETPPIGCRIRYLGPRGR